MMATETKTNPFMKRTTTTTTTTKPHKVSSRWANLEITEEILETKNSFIRDDSGIFSSNNRQKNNFGPYSRNFMRFTKPRPPTPPPVFNMIEADKANEFPALGS